MQMVHVSPLITRYQTINLYIHSAAINISTLSGVVDYVYVQLRLLCFSPLIIPCKLFSCYLHIKQLTTLKINMS